ncbi:TPA: hypothetical protein HMG37_25750 [Escherichia coli]|nr:hypothetical protein AL477_26300 [Shigella sonnei]MDI4392221.1 hypothetical protein [Escherichia coli]EFP9211144.1 hypothetical protein [Shigella sonnei]EFW3213784.1 hypothetical protein [Shigella sonnei]EFW4004335.1 hypothetical protein [Shigella sonnei]
MKCHKSSMWEMGSKIPVQNLLSGGRKLVILTCSPFGGALGKRKFSHAKRIELNEWLHLGQLTH